MRAQNALLSGLSTLLLLFSLALPQTGLAQQPVAERAAPRIEGFDVVPARRLSAGSELAFTLYGTAGGTASVRIGNMTKRILLDEVETGVYEGSYTIKTSDRIVAATTTTVNLRVGNQIATGMLDESLLAGARSQQRAQTRCRARLRLPGSTASRSRHPRASTRANASTSRCMARRPAVRACASTASGASSSWKKSAPASTRAATS